MSKSTEATVHALFEHQARLSPHATALVVDAAAEGETSGEVGPEQAEPAHHPELTYAELDARATRLARELIARGVRPEQPVAVLAHRSPGLVVATLAVFKAGAVFLPIDPALPRARVQLLLKDAQPGLVVTVAAPESSIVDGAIPSMALDRWGATVEPTVADGTAPLPKVDIRQVAYLMYTSGSTGRPKGVLVTHAGVAGLVESQRDRLAPGPGSTVLQFASPSFDASFWELCMGLLSGARLLVAGSDQVMPGPELVALLRRHQVTHVTLPPSALAVLSPQDLPTVTDMTVAGEALPPDLVADWAAGRRMVNAYGPTECTVCVSISSVLPAPGATPPIGLPVSGTRVYVLGESLELVPPGVTGELYVTGEGLARGYLGMPGQTADRFVADPYGEPGQRMYRTGDLARWNNHGELEFEGRVDDQVKIRGFRIEPGEVESALRAHSSVASAAVTLWDQPAGPQLAGYVVPAAAGEVDTEGEKVGAWRGLYDSLYADPQPPTGPDFTGWNSVYDGEPIPSAEMLEWRDETVSRIHTLSPRRVLEVGAGSGLILTELVGDCESYWATDISAAAVERLEDRRRQLGASGRHMEVRRLPADSVDGLPTGYFDTIILNSVIQYLPSRDHLDRVMLRLFDLLADGGSVFVGDVRDLRSLRVLREAVHRTRTSAPDDPAERAAAVSRAVRGERELLVAPDYFAALGARLPGLGSVEVQTKRGRAHNELTRYRYDVVLPKSLPTPTDSEHRIDWHADLADPDALERLITGADTRLRLCRVPNGRITADLPPGSESGVDPEFMHELGERLGYGVAVVPSGGGERGEYDVLLCADGRRPRASYLPVDPPPAAEQWTNLPATPPQEDLSAVLREWLVRQLPDYLVPASIQVVDELPLTISGKIDRSRLPRPNPVAAMGRRPRTATEEILCGLFEGLLGVERVGIDESFFERGGHSLLATRLVSRVRSALGVELPLRLVFEEPTVAGLAKIVGEADRARPAVTRMPRPEGMPLSFAQQRLWFINRLEGHSATYNMPLALWLSGDLDHEALRSALRDVVARHESLRTVFPEVRGTPRQVILTPEEAGPDLVTELVEENELVDRLHTTAREGFDLAVEPPLRARLLVLPSTDNTPPSEQVLLLVLHHIAGDGWSMGPLARDIALAYEARYRGEAPGWQPLPVQYADYTLWQREMLGSEDDPDSVLSRDLAYWRQTLAEMPDSLRLPVDRPRPAVSSYDGGLVEFDMDRQLWKRLDVLARDGQMTLYMVLHTGLAVLLSRMGAGTDIPIGTAVANRTDDTLDELVGFFVNMLVLRVDLGGNPTFREALQRVKEADLSAYAHQDVPFDRLVETLSPTRSASRQPLFQVAFGLQNAPSGTFALPGLDVNQTGVGVGRARFDLWFTVHERHASDEQDGSLSGFVEYSTDLFDRDTVAKLVDRWFVLLEAMVADPDRRITRADILTPDERRQLGAHRGSVAP
ncbi:amino acid adenylation domain-containing protein [Stackebrandtia endophytica]|uniref:Amino acid adenylation domain-containing protein n=1 Tax=Stackebrandtia endophytica TaxID=1496996 RepID=A0A543B2K0_9ACTN|nr:non-ribosomal peptide synthetase [Stackebrandtia endophytica]TQL79026.1 amino acid adenylation domain-containing protein [Stackebrandtia endophytica]